MIVVSDTSAVSALLSLGEAHLLHVLFGEVLITEMVQVELLRHHPSLPEFLHVSPVREQWSVDALSSKLDPGEAAAIVLAREVKADLLLIDEKLGRRIAVEQGIKIIGLVGVVLLGKQQGLIASASTFIERLEKEAGFYLSKEVRRAALWRTGEIE